MDLLAATTNLRRYTGNPVYDKNGNLIKTGLYTSLKMMGLQHYYQLFKKEEIDFVAIGIMDERDIASLVNKNDLNQMLLFCSFFQNIYFFQQARPG
jgi:aryl carrier-like protein